MKNILISFADHIYTMYIIKQNTFVHLMILFFLIFIVITHVYYYDSYYIKFFLCIYFYITVKIIFNKFITFKILVVMNVLLMLTKLPRSMY